jgi:hypothetical protein
MGDRGTSGLAVGRTVHFDEHGTHMKADVVGVLDKESGHIKVAVFNTNYNTIQWIECLPGTGHGTWHWPEYEP